MNGKFMGAKLPTFFLGKDFFNLYCALQPLVLLWQKLYNQYCLKPVSIIAFRVFMPKNGRLA